MSYLLPHLRTGWAVDQAILNEEDRVVVIRFGHDYDPVCMQMDEALSKIVEKVKNFAVIYLVDITEVPDFNTMRARRARRRAARRRARGRRRARRYELYDPCTVMNFFRNKHIMIDLGTGNNNKINWALTNSQELIDLIETVYRGARKGRGLVVSPKDYSTKRGPAPRSRACSARRIARAAGTGIRPRARRLRRSRPTVEPRRRDARVPYMPACIWTSAVAVVPCWQRSS
jgi:DIM1 family U5 snRNP protein